MPVLDRSFNKFFLLQERKTLESRRRRRRRRRLWFRLFFPESRNKSTLIESFPIRTKIAPSFSLTSSGNGRLEKRRIR